MKTHRTLFEKLCDEETLYEAWKSIRSKKASGGIDGVTLSAYEENIQQNLLQIQNELKAGTWEPEPYLTVCIPKKKKELRRLGLLSIKDKIVQNAIKRLIEPTFESLFVDQSYAYRPNKGHAKAVRRAYSECDKKQHKWVLRLDIDDYFDNICLEQLTQQLHQLFPTEEELVRLIVLSIQMGIVNKRLKWSDRIAGVPQGAILSPILANFYLHPFDKYVLTLKRFYVRYADDFCILCESKEEAESLYKKISVYLQTQFGLKLNPPIITSLQEGFEFLGITIDVSDDRRRSRVVKILEKVGIRVNYSVFECMLTDSQFEKLQQQIAGKINRKEDQVIYYPICLSCFTKIVYQPTQKKEYPKVVVV